MYGAKSVGRDDPGMLAVAWLLGRSSKPRSPVEAQANRVRVRLNGL
jgi:hypothetical protein